MIESVLGEILNCLANPFLGLPLLVTSIITLYAIVNVTNLRLKGIMNNTNYNFTRYTA